MKSLAALRRAAPSGAPMAAVAGAAAYVLVVVVTALLIVTETGAAAAAHLNSVATFIPGIVAVVSLSRLYGQPLRTARGGAALGASAAVLGAAAAYTVSAVFVGAGVFADPVAVAMARVADLPAAEQETALALIAFVRSPLGIALDVLMAMAMSAAGGALAVKVGAWRRRGGLAVQPVRRDGQAG